MEKHLKLIKAIAFDIDGTLYSSEFLIAKAYQKSLTLIKQDHHLDFTIPSFQKIISYIGLPNQFLFNALVPIHIQSFYPQFTSINSKILKDSILAKEGKLIDGTKELLTYLHSKNIAPLVASNGSLNYINDFIKTYHLHFTNPIIGLDKGKNIIQKADILEYYLNYFNLKNNEIIMVGDRYNDLEAAKKHNIFFIGLKSGIGYNVNPKELEGADLLLDNIHTLLEYLQQN